jgi:hypothetical protein
MCTSSPSQGINHGHVEMVYAVDGADLRQAMSQMNISPEMDNLTPHVSSRI